jgi:hypothetical protein
MTRLIRIPKCLVLIVIAVLCASAGLADESLKGIACRSVHLGYPAAEGTAFYNELTVEKSAPGTYFMTCGFDGGYFGIQELASGKKVVLFSVWDPGEQNDPQRIAEDQRVKLLHKDDAVRVGRFGNEGTGGQSFFDYDWHVGETCKFCVTARPAGERTEYSAFLFVVESREWKQLVTFSTLNSGKLLRGCYSFIEDFKRDRVSATKVRRARFGNGWVRTKEGSWTALTRARFTADRNPVMNVDAGVVDGRFYLATGGETENSGAKLNAFIDVPPPGSDLPAAILAPESALPPSRTGKPAAAPP